jgi:hypothetical protein
MVLTKYVDHAPRAEDKPKRELTISEWLQAMADEGFDGVFVATNNDGRIYKGDISPDADGKMRVHSKKVPTKEEVKNRLRELKNNGNV